MILTWIWQNYKHGPTWDQVGPMLIKKHVHVHAQPSIPLAVRIELLKPLGVRAFTVVLEVSSQLASPWLQAQPTAESHRRHTARDALPIESVMT